MSSFQLTSAIRYDPLYAQPSPFFLLPNHFDRLRTAAALHGWQDTLTSLSWSSFQSTCNCAVQEYDGPAKGGPLKVRSLVYPFIYSFLILFLQLRLVLHRAGTITVTITPVSPLTADPMLAAHISPSTDYLHPSLGDPIALFLDKSATPSSPFTSTKTTNRGHYQAARARFGLPDAGGPADVILWNTNGMITETSVRNLAFFRHCRWVTPHDSTGCLPGVMRRQLLEQGLVLTDDRGLLSRDNVRDGELVIVFNAVEGCRIAVAHVRKV